MDKRDKTPTEILKNKLDGTFNILLELEFMKQTITEVSNKESKYFEGSSKNSQFLNTVYKTFVRMFVVDLYKFIDKNSHFYILKTINYCKTNLSKIDWHHSISYEELEKLENKYSIPQNIHKEIKTLRDKYYAHLDQDRFEFDISIKPDDLWQILKDIQDIFTTICASFNNTQWIFHIQFRGVPELRMINNYKLLQGLINEYHKNKMDKIETDELLKILRN